jgi:hypothetical protein
MRFSERNSKFQSGSFDKNTGLKSANAADVLKVEEFNALTSFHSRNKRGEKDDSRTVSFSNRSLDQSKQSLAKPKKVVSLNIDKLNDKRRKNPSLFSIR